MTTCRLYPGSHAVRLIILIVGCAGLCSEAAATILRVPADYPLIQDGLDAAAPDDTVIVAAGTYTGAGNRDLDFQGKGLRLQSEDGAEFTIIDCQGSKADPHRGLHFHGSEDSTAVLTGFTIQNGYAPGDPGLLLSNGGGILFEASSPTVVDCVIRANTAQNAGGGLACLDGSAPLLMRCRVEGNLADNYLPAPIASYGGGLRCHSSSPVLRYCVFANNRANVGGAISCNQSLITYIPHKLKGALAHFCR